MEKDQDRALVKAPAPEREWDPERVKDLVLERELVQVQVLVLDWVRAAAMERNPVLALETDQAMVQPPETDRVMDQELGWESAEHRCHRRCCRLACHRHVHHRSYRRP